MRPRGPTCFSPGPIRVVLYAFLISLATLGGCASEASQPPPPGTPEETRAATQETTQEVEQLTARDAVGQMFVVGMSSTEPDPQIEEMVRERNVGGVLLLGYNMESEEQTRRLVDSLQELATQTSQDAMPLFVAVDHEGGEVQHAPWVPAQPSAAEVGGRADPREAGRVAEEIGRELRHGGVNTDLAPVVDTGYGAAIGSRSYGDDPDLVGRMGAAAVEGFERSGVVSAAKHFPNHGPALVDSHTERPRIDHDTKTIMNRDLPPFRAAVEVGVPMVMVGHLVYPSIDTDRPASLSPTAMKLLREDLGFDGVILTDDLAMEGATRGETPAQAGVEAVEAGADLLLITSSPEEQVAAYEAVVAAVESGEIPRERIDASVERIEKLKNRYPLYSGGSG